MESKKMENPSFRLTKYALRGKFQIKVYKKASAIKLDQWRLFCS